MARFGRDMMTYATADLLGSSIGLVLSPIFTRLFTPAQYGAQAALAAVWSFVALAQYGGMDSAYPVFRTRTTDDRVRARLLVTASFVAVAAALFVSGLFGVVGLSTQWLMAFAGVTRRELLCYVLTLTPSAAMAWFLYVLRFERRATAFARVSLLGRFAGGVLLVPALMMAAQTRRLEIGFLVTAAVTSFAALLGAWELRRAGWPPFDRERFDRGEANAMLQFGLVLVPGYIVYAASTVLDRLLVTWFAGQSETAILALALRLGAVATMLRTWFALVWDPHLVEWIAALPRDVLNARLQTAAGMISRVAALLFAMAALWTAPVVRLLYPRDYWSTIPLVPWLVLGVGISALSLVAVATTTIAKTAKLHLPVYSLGLVVNLAIGCWWVPKLGAAGAVAGAVAAEVCILASWVFVGTIHLRNLALSWWRTAALLAVVVALVAFYREGMILGAHVVAERMLISAVFVVALGMRIARDWRDLRGKAS